MHLYRYYFATMGCPAEVCLYAADRKAAETAFTIAETECRRLDHKYSHYRADSYQAELLAAADHPEGSCVDAETAALLDFAGSMHRESQGRFDITAGKLTALWDRCTDLPEPGAISAALALTGWNKIEWDGIRLQVPKGMHLDLGAIVKEYAADRAAMLLGSAGFESGYIDLGGDLYILGPHPDGQPWRIGIRNPRGPGALAGNRVFRGGLATSGDYERCSIIDGRRYGHVISPVSGWPVNGLASVSVAAPSCLLAGAVCTLAMLTDAQAGLEFLSVSGLSWLANDGRESFSGRRAGTPGNHTMSRGTAFVQNFVNMRTPQTHRSDSITP